MENQGDKEKSTPNNDRERLIAKLNRDIARLENSIEKTGDVRIIKRELPKITTAVDNLNLFPIKEVLVQTSKGWETKVVPFLLIKTYPTSASDDFCLTPEGILYKVENQPLTAEDYRAWRQISPLAPGYLKWSRRVEISDQEYRRLAPRIFKGLRFLINNV